MKLEKKIILQFVVILLILGAIFFLAGFAIIPLFVLWIHKWLKISMGSHPMLLYFLFYIPFVVFFVFMGLFIGRKVSKPLFFLLHWIDLLAAGKYQQPTNQHDFLMGKIKFGPFAELDTKLAMLTDKLKAAEHQKRELETTRRNWVSGISHDLKTPLSYIKGYTVMLKSGHAWSQQEIEEFVQIIEEKTLHMEQLIDDLNIAFLYEQSQIPVKIKPIHISSFMTKVVADLDKHPIAKKYDLQLKRMVDPETEWLCDEKLLNRILDNLLINAIQHNPVDTTIIVTVAVESENLLVEIKDNGKGMDASSVSQLFATNKAELSTSGLGILIVKRFVERLQGRIQVESRLHQGTTIILCFPMQN